MIFPYDNIDMDIQIDILCKPKSTNGTPFIIRYEVEYLKLIQILNWNKHQKPHHTEKDSIFPPIPPLKEKIKIKNNIKIKIKQNEASRELDNALTTVKEPLKKADGYNCRFFNEFWDNYPKKIGKGKAWEEWNRIGVKKDEILIKTMISVIDHFKTTEQWQKDNGQYIPNPATWLHQKRWEDEIMEPIPNSDSFAGEKLWLKMQEAKDEATRQGQISHGNI
jgi:hypothetical protein